jgi:hypothetical protein
MDEELLIWNEFRWPVDRFYESHGVLKAAIFVSVLKNVFSVCGLGVVRFYISRMFIISDCYVPVSLTYVRLITCPAGELIYSTVIEVCGIIWVACVLVVFGFDFVSKCVGGSEGYVT